MMQTDYEEDYNLDDEDLDWDALFAMLEAEGIIEPKRMPTSSSSSSNPTTLYRPLSQMSFIVTLTGSNAMTVPTAAFSEVTGVEATVDVIEFRQGNSSSLAPIKVPGMVKHGNITLKFGYTEDSAFKDWVMSCVSEQRPALVRNTLTIELMDTASTAVGSTDLSGSADKSEKRSWVLANAWVCKYTGVDFNAATSGIAMESVEVAYESLTIPNKEAAAASKS